MVLHGFHQTFKHFFFYCFPMHMPVGLESLGRLKRLFLLLLEHTINSVDICASCLDLRIGLRFFCEE